MSNLSTPPPPAEFNFTDTPPTSPCGNNTIMPNPPHLVIRSSNPTKLKRKLALTFASLYDDELIINNVKTEEKIALASPLWENTEPKIISGNDSEAVKSHLGLRAVEIDVISGNQAKELTPPPGKKATSQTTESIPIDPDTPPTVVTHASREISNSTIGIASKFEDLGSAVGESSDGTDSNNDFAIRHEWTGTSQFDTVINISIDLQKEASNFQLAYTFTNYPFNRISSTTSSSTAKPLFTILAKRPTIPTSISTSPNVMPNSVSRIPHPITRIAQFIF